MVLPPWYRRFVRRTAEESRRLATKRREELLAMLNDERWIGDCRDGTDRPDKLLVEEGLETEAAIRALGPTWEEPPLNRHYRGVVNVSARVRRLGEIGAPIDVIAEEGRSLVSHVRLLVEEILARESELGEEVTLRALSLTR